MSRPKNTGIKLLAAIREIFQERGTDRISTKDLLGELIDRDGDEPWAACWQKDFNAENIKGPAAKLARLLKPFGIIPETIRESDGIWIILNTVYKCFDLQRPHRTMRELRRAAGIGFMLILCAACKQPTRDVATLSAKELEVVEYVLRMSYGDGRYPTGYLNFLTTTPMPNPPSQWKWKDLPDDFHKRISDLPVQFAKASEAYLDGGQCVRQKGTHIDGYMHWVSITRWLSDEEVEVDMGRWSRQLHGGGRTYLLQKKSGKWSVKKCVRLWVT